MQQNDDSPLNDLQNRFTTDPLTDPEMALIRAVSEGGRFDSGVRDGDPATIRAELLRWLCAEPEYAGTIGLSGIQVTGVRITGVLNLDYTKIPFPVTFSGCTFTDDIRLNYADVRSVILENCRITSFHGEHLSVHGLLRLINGVYVRGTVFLNGSRIDGDFDCSGGYFLNPGGKTIIANRIEVTGSVRLDHGFKSEGEVQFIDARIDGNLSCAGGTFRNEGGDALSADRAVIGGSVFITDTCTINGTVRLPGASINGQLSFDFCTFTGTGRSGLFGQNLQVREGFFWRKVGTTDSMELNLSHAAVGQLCDDMTSAPAPGKLILEGFTYREIAGESPVDGVSRTGWLSRQPESPFHPQPYEQLATALKRSGYEDEARSILVEKEKRRLRFGNLSRRAYFWNVVIGVALGFGYRPYRIVYFMAGFILVGTVLFHLGYRYDAFAPTNVIIMMQEQYRYQRMIPEAYPAFNPLIFSLDTFLPIVNLHQEAYWLPNVNRGGLGIFLYWYMRFQIVIGWVLTSLAILGFSGLVRKD